jgi:hypothetical protein
MTYRTCKAGSHCHTANVEYDGTSATSVLGKTPAERALVPYELSKAIRNACEAGLDGDVSEQTTLAASTGGPSNDISEGVGR